MSTFLFNFIKRCYLLLLRAKTWLVKNLYSTFVDWWKGKIQESVKPTFSEDEKQKDDKSSLSNSKLLKNFQLISLWIYI